MDVRRCATCGEAAAISVRDWGQSTWGMDTGAISRQEFRCQACGADFDMGSSASAWIRFILGGFFLVVFGLPIPFSGLVTALGGIAALQPGVVLSGLCMMATTPVLFVGAWYAVKPLWIRFRHPIVADAPLPEKRFGARRDVPLRTCSCGEVARCDRVVANTTNGLPTGTDYFYVCDHCGEDFELESPWGMVFSSMGTMLVGFIGFAILVASLPSSFAALSQSGTWIGMACSGAAFLVALILSLSTAMKLLNRFLHPVFPMPEET